MTAPSHNSTQWLCSGREIFPAMLEAIRNARRSIELEIYTYSDHRIGRECLGVLIHAAQAGVRVRVLVDAFGSFNLPPDYFAPLIQAGGEARFFNPLRFSRFGVRDHRKILVCDGRTAFIGGANISDEYDGDGITQGWFDTGCRIEDESLATALTDEFERMFEGAGLEKRRLPRFRVFRKLRRRLGDSTKILAVQPGRGPGIFQLTLQRDLAHAKSADLITPYFLPNRRLLKLLRKIVKRGGRVRLILPAHCDVPLARAAALVYYLRLLRSGVEIHEFQPQILHAKLFIVDETVYAGSSNLDIRSLKLNYEIMLRYNRERAASGPRQIFQTALANSRRIELDEFKRSQNPWQRWKNRWAHFLVARVDPLIALRQFQALPDTRQTS